MFRSKCSREGEEKTNSVCSTSRESPNIQMVALSTATSGPKPLAGPSDISQNANARSTQLKLTNYLKTPRAVRLCSASFRNISAEYSQKENAVYCFSCRFFSRRSDIRITPFASASGFKNLKDAPIRMPEHSASERHK